MVEQDNSHRQVQESRGIHEFRIVDSQVTAVSSRVTPEGPPVTRHAIYSKAGSFTTTKPNGWFELHLQRKKKKTQSEPLTLIPLPALFFLSE